MVWRVAFVVPWNLNICSRAFQVRQDNSLFHEAGGETGLLDGAVGDKLDPETVRRRLDVFWHLVATEGSNQISP